MKKFLAICFSLLILSSSIFAQNEKTSCPAFQVIEPSTLTKPGDAMTFLVKAENESLNLKYLWIVSAGSIIEGQNTSIIKVATTSEMSGSLITSKVTIQGLSGECQNEFSGVAGVAVIRDIEPIDKYGKVSRNEEAGRLDNLFSQLRENPETFAFIRLYRGENGTKKRVKSRIKKIINHADFREFPKHRLIFSIENSHRERTVIFIFSEKNKIPECENCEIVKGADVK